MRAITLIALCLLLAACEDEAEKAMRHDKLCQSYGAKPDTPEYINCRAIIHVAEDQQEQIDSANAVAGFSIGFAASQAGSYRR